MNVKGMIFKYSLSLTFRFGSANKKTPTKHITFQQHFVTMMIHQQEEML